MAQTIQIRPPFLWLGKYGPVVSVISAVAIGAFFRFFQIGTLPPGLYEGSAAIGLQALNLAERDWLPGLGSANGYAPLWIWLQAMMIKLLGHTELALRIWPALLGTLAVLTMWLWLRAWFGLRIAWIGAFLLAVTPWAVTLSRNGVEAAIFPLLVSLTLWLATRAWRRQRTGSLLALVGALTLDLLSGPIGWLLAACVIVTGLALLARGKQLFVFNRSRALAFGALAIVLGGFAYLLGVSLAAIKALPHDSGLVTGAQTLGSNIIRTLLMFNVAGDDNYRHNLAGEPMLNAFVGLMLVAGLLVGISRLHERRYRVLFVFFVVLLAPAMITSVGVPNAGRAVAALPVVLALAAIGISYMLELWYRTFPINSAARATGQSAIIVLLGLTFFQGYTQYFNAWAGSSEVYAAYNEGAVQISHRLHDQQHSPKTKFDGSIYVVAPADEQPIVAYLDHHDVPYTATDAKGVVSLPVTPGNRQFWIAAPSRDEAVKSLKAKFPGGILRPKYSDFNQAEIYYTYEVTK